MKEDSKQKGGIAQTITSAAESLTTVAGLWFNTKKLAGDISETIWESTPIAWTRANVRFFAEKIGRTIGDTPEQTKALNRLQKDMKETVATMEEAEKKGWSRARVAIDFEERNYTTKP